MVTPILPHRQIYDEIDPDEVLAQLISDMQALDPTWMPATTDPLRLTFSVLAGHLTRRNIYFNARARGAFSDDAVGADLDGVCITFGVRRATSELDEPLRRRRDTHMDAIGRSANYAAYMAETLDADATIADAVVTLDIAPNEGRVIVNLLSTAAASESRADNLLGVPAASVVTAIQTYLRDPVRLRVGDERIIARAATPTEYRIAVLMSPATAEAAARQAIYDYIDAHRRFGATLRASNLATAIENAGAAFADVTTFNALGSSGNAVLTATGAVYYDCAKNTTGVDITTS